MELFKVFSRTRKQRPGARKTAPATRRSEPSIHKLGHQIKDLKRQVSTVHIALRHHEGQIKQCQNHIQQHTQGLETLEQKIAAPISVPSPLSVSASPPRPHCNIDSPGKVDINRFSEQEKRVLRVFFENKHQSMSYADVARALNKSPNTVKNQIRQIRSKANLFECTLGKQSRNLLKLRDGFRVEQYLNITEPAEKTISSPCPSDGNSKQPLH